MSAAVIRKKTENELPANKHDRVLANEFAKFLWTNIEDM